MCFAAIVGWGMVVLLGMLLFLLHYPPLLEYHAGFQEGVYRVNIVVRNATDTSRLVKVFLLNPARPEANPYAHWVEQETIAPHSKCVISYFVGQDPDMKEVFIGVAAFDNSRGALPAVLTANNLSGFFILHRDQYRWGDIYGSVEIRATERTRFRKAP
jgi:hypothetical protein